MRLINLFAGGIVTLYGVVVLTSDFKDLQGWLSIFFGIGIVVSAIWFNDPSSKDGPSDGGDWGSDFGSGDSGGDGCD